MAKENQEGTGWEHIGGWYDEIVGKEGHYYHKNIILPRLLPLFDFPSFTSPSLLDLGCGQGILARYLPPSITYTGIDLSPTFIKKAEQGRAPGQNFLVGDICKPLPIKKKTFSHAAIILALQNVEQPEVALKNASDHLINKGRLAIVLNHPCFRIPRQSSWGVDHKQKIQYRRIDHYLSPLKIPIQTHPGQKEKSPISFSFHHSLSDYSLFLVRNGFVIERLEEWVSDKVSQGGAAKMENRARAEIPLFMTIIAVKV